MRPIFCGLGLGLDTAGLGLGLGTAGLGLGLGLELEVSVLNYFSRPPMCLPNPFHMVACLFLPVTQVTQFLTYTFLHDYLDFTVDGGIFMRPHRGHV